MGKIKVAIVGGGAAGFFAAITAKAQHPEAEVRIIERSAKVLAKVAVTGGGRCNLTNSFEDIADLRQAYPRGFRLMKRLFNVFDHRDACRWFEARGVRLVTQPDRCVFPQSQDAMTIVGCLENEARRLGVRVLTGQRVASLSAGAHGGWELSLADGSATHADRVAVTTGGMPGQGDFLSLRRLGHEVLQPIPSLFTFNIAEPSLPALMGTVVSPVVVGIPGTKLRAAGPLLVTHWGMSGPAVLKLSSYAARHLEACDYQSAVAVNWAGGLSCEAVSRALQQLAHLHPQKLLLSIRPFGLPLRLWQYLLGKTGNSAERRWAEMGGKSLNRLVEVLTNDTYPICGKGSFREEFVTCGGVSPASIDYNTLQSKHCDGLFFAGEVLDIDAITGGFNLQAAWTTGYVVGQHIADPELR